MNIGLTSMVSDYYVNGYYQPYQLDNVYNGLNFSNVLGKYMLGQSYGNLYGVGNLCSNLTNLTNGSDCSIITQNIGTSKMSIVIPEELRAKMLLEGKNYCIRLDENGNSVNVLTSSKDSQMQTTTEKQKQEKIAQENKVKKVTQMVKEHNHMLGQCSVKNRITVQI